MLEAERMYVLNKACLYKMMNGNELQELKIIMERNLLLSILVKVVYEDNETYQKLIKL